jgi:F-type H+-transporting ATPase subunit c
VRVQVRYFVFGIIEKDFLDFCLGIGTVFGSLVVAYARNPSLKQQLFSYAILGFALSEAMGLFCLMMAFM